MSFGRKGIIDKAHSVHSKSTRVRYRAGIIILKVILGIIIAACLGVGVYAYSLIRTVINDSPSITLEDVKPEGYTSTITDKDGNILQTLTGADANREYIELDEITEDTQHAFVAIEDSRFYEHNGIDPQGIARAFVVGIKNGMNFTEGASTITQQLLKNSTFDFMSEKTFSDKLKRKIQEIYLSVQLEKLTDKDTIMEYYLNTINLGQNTLGIEKASKRYFDKDAKDLTLSEAAVIAGITQNPSKYNPISNPDKNAKRRAKVLKNMYEQGYITKEEREEALKDDVYSRIQTVNAKYEQQTASTNSYFVDATIDQVIDDLQEECGYTEEQAYRKLYSGGLTITSTEDPSIQTIVDEEMNNDANYPSGTKYELSYALTVITSDGEVSNYSSNQLLAYLQSVYGSKYSLLYSDTSRVQSDIDAYKASLNIPADAVVTENSSLAPQPQASIVIMDQKTGLVKAIGGGRGAKTSSRSFNRATDSTRQPGSCFKVLSTYAPAIDAKGYTLYTPITDEPFNYESGTPVKNWYSGYKGTVTLRYAIALSMNICAVKTLTEITPQLGYDYLLKFGFTTLVDGWESSDGKIYSDVAQPLALGGITKGITNLEITAAYATIANNGTYTEPCFYTKIVDHEGKVLIDKTPKTHEVLKDSTAALLTDAMTDVITYGTGGRASLGAMPVSGKTGTTSNNYDIWFCGFTPYYTCSVWGGYDTSVEMSNTSWHLTLWKSIMSRVHQNLEVKQFEYPESVEEMTLCTETGMKPRSGCPTATGLFAKTSKSQEYCTQHSGSTEYKNYQNDDSDDDFDDDEEYEDEGEGEGEESEE